MSTVSVFLTIIGQLSQGAECQLVKFDLLDKVVNMTVRCYPNEIFNDGFEGMDLDNGN